MDKLAEAGQSYWQILPLSPTSYGDSPYQSFSSFAGHPYFIDPETLIREGVLTRAECDACDFGDDPTRIDYGKLYLERIPLLRKAYERSEIYKNPEFLEFCRKNSWWLEDYALFMAVKQRFGGRAWSDWAEDIRRRWGYSMDYYRRECYFEIEFYRYLQYEFAVQWKRLKEYANGKGVQIIGDIPIYVAFDSADAWAHPEMFQFDSDGKPAAVAGCPPDAFSATGQLWGNPLYRWDYHRATGYDWWCRRIAHCFSLYDVVRIDHFRGFDEYYCIPYGDRTAENGHWEKGPGIELFRAIEAKLGRKNIIAEDLGFMTDTVIQLLKDSGYPGMKVLEFAFVPGKETGYLPHSYDRNCVVYTGTHDNETLVQWYQGLDRETRKYAAEYMNNADTPDGRKYWDFIRLAMMSSANLCVIPLQDYLGLGGEARINHPSTLGENWRWRMSRSMLTHQDIKKIYALTKISFRLSEKMKDREEKVLAEKAKQKEEKTPSKKVKAREEEILAKKTKDKKLTEGAKDKEA